MLKERCYKVEDLTVDLDTMEDVPVDEVKVEIKNISSARVKELIEGGIFLPSCIIKKPVKVWKWKEQLWIPVDVFEKEF